MFRRNSKTIAEQQIQAEQLKKLQERGPQTGKMVTEPMQKKYNQQKIFKGIQNKDLLDRQLQKDILFVLQDKKPLSKEQEEMIESALPIKGTLTSSFVTVQKLNFEKIKELSIYPILSELYLQIFSNLVELQTQIDPVTLKPMKIPGQDQSIIKYLHILNQSTRGTLEKIEIILEIYKQNENTYKIMKQRVVSALLNKIQQAMKFFNYQIGYANFKKIIFNNKTGKFSVDKAQKIQNKAIQNAIKQFNEQNFPDIEQFNKQYCSRIMERQQFRFKMQTDKKQKRQFIEVKDVPNPNEQINAQIKYFNKVIT